MDRRSFLLSLGTITLSQSLTGCRSRPTAALQVNLLTRSLPPQLISQFQSQIKSEAEFKLSLISSAAQLFTDLQQRAVKETAPARKSILQSITEVIFGPPPKDVYPVSSLGDYWLQAAIAQNLIRPWSVETLKGWQTLAPQCQQIVKRDRQGRLSTNGAVWGLPYRWGATLIVFRKDKFRELGWTPTDWADLWRPELKNHISLLDQPREVIGLTLKKLKRSYNTSNLEGVSELRTQLQRLHQQVKVYSSTDYLQPLLLEDTWLAVGWSTDILPLIAEESELGFVVPSSGTALWSDVWVQPAKSLTQLALPQQWAEFWWQPEIAKALSEFTDSVSPVLQALAVSNTSQQRLWPKQPWFDNSEFLEPLAPATLQQYKALWQQVRGR